MRSTAKTGLGSIHLSRRTLCGTALPQVNTAVRSRADLVGFLRREYETFPDAQEAILDIFAEGEKVAVRHHFRGTQHGAMGSYLPTGKAMNAEYITIYRVRNGQILEAWAEWDNLAGLRQLGHL